MPKIGQRFNPHRMFDGVFIPEAICKYKGVSPGAKLAYGRFCRFAGRNGEVFPSLKTLGEEIGCGPTQARAYVKELVADRFVEVEEETGKPNSYYFLWHPAFDGEVGRVRFTPLQDAGGVENCEVPLQDPGGPPLQDPAGVPLQDAGAEESHLKESQKRESYNTSSKNQNAEPTQPLNTESATRNICSWIKHLRGTKGFNAQCKAIVAERVQRLDAGWSEESLRAAFEEWSGETYWREYETPHKVRAFFKWLEDRPALAPAADFLNGEPGATPVPGLAEWIETAPTATPAPASAPVPAPAPAPALPPEAMMWNQLVTAAPPVALFSWSMEEGASLTRCRRNPDFTPNWPGICAKVQELLSGGNEKTQFLAGFQWVIRKDENWWKILSGGYDHMGAAPAAKSGGGMEDWVREASERADARRKARRANG